MKKIFLFILLLLPANLVFSQYYLEWDEHAYLSIPDPPFNGYVAHANWNVNNRNLTFKEADESGAIIYPNHYFEGTSVVTCNYRYEYYRNGRYQTATAVASYTVRFKSVDVVLDKSEIFLNIGKKATLKASFPSTTYVPNCPMKWSSGDETVVTVSDKSSTSNWSTEIKALSSGETTVTLDPVIGPPQECKVTVAYVAPQEAKITPESLYLTVGKSTRLNISYTPQGASAKSVTWESSDDNVATVSSSGFVKGVSQGKAVVTATTDNGVRASAKVEVLPLPQSVSLPSAVSVYMGFTKEVVPNVVPEKSESSFSWKTSDPSVATVSLGKITGVKAGRAVITVTTENGKTASCEVTVKRTPIELNYKNVTNRANVIETMVKQILKK